MVHVALPKTLAVSLLVATLVAGCSGGSPEETPLVETPEIEVTSTTGGIRGVVVDEAVRPIKDAEVVVESTDKSAKSDENGVFTVSGLEAGVYVVKASHPLFSVVQQTVEVEAGVADPPAVKLQLQRVVFATPYLQTLKYDGFVVCSANVVVALSEECGEGVGVDCAVPVFGCQRVGGQGNNEVQFDFTVGAGTKTVVIEQSWEATSDAGKAFYSPISTEWSCLPVCSGNVMAEMEGESPIYAVLDNATLEDNDIVPDETIISVFTWASRESTGVLLNQQFTTFVTTFHYLPAPEGWSFVRGDPSPF